MLSSAKKGEKIQFLTSCLSQKWVPGPLVPLCDSIHVRIAEGMLFSCPTARWPSLHHIMPYSAPCFIFRECFIDRDQVSGNLGSSGLRLGICVCCASMQIKGLVLSHYWMLCVCLLVLICAMDCDPRVPLIHICMPM